MLKSLSLSFLLILAAAFYQSTQTMDKIEELETKRLAHFTNEEILNIFTTSMDHNYNNYEGSKNPLSRAYNFSKYIEKLPLQKEHKDIFFKGYALELQRYWTLTHCAPKAFAHEIPRPNLVFQAIATNDLMTLNKQLYYLDAFRMDFGYLGFHPLEFALILENRIIAGMLFKRTGYPHLPYPLSQRSGRQLIKSLNDKSASFKIRARPAISLTNQ